MTNVAVSSVENPPVRRSKNQPSYRWSTDRYSYSILYCYVCDEYTQPGCHEFLLDPGDDASPEVRRSGVLDCISSPALRAATLSIE